MKAKTKDMLLLINRVSKRMASPENFSIRLNVIEQLCDLELPEIHTAIDDLKNKEFIRVIKGSLDTITLTAKGRSFAEELLEE